MTRLAKVLLLLAAASTFAVSCWPTRARRARKLARRSPPRLPPDRFAPLDSVRPA